MSTMESVSPLQTTTKESLQCLPLMDGQPLSPPSLSPTKVSPSSPTDDDSADTNLDDTLDANDPAVADALAALRDVKTPDWTALSAEFGFNLELPRFLYSDQTVENKEVLARNGFVCSELKNVSTANSSAHTYHPSWQKANGQSSDLLGNPPASVAAPGLKKSSSNIEGWIDKSSNTTALPSSGVHEIRSWVGRRNERRKAFYQSCRTTILSSSWAKANFPNVETVSAQVEDQDWRFEFTFEQEVSRKGILKTTDSSSMTCAPQLPIVVPTLFRSGSSRKRSMKIVLNSGESQSSSSEVVKRTKKMVTWDPMLDLDGVKMLLSPSKVPISRDVK